MADLSIALTFMLASYFTSMPGPTYLMVEAALSMFRISPGRAGVLLLTMGSYRLPHMRVTSTT
jgi:hypothetical protein